MIERLVNMKPVEIPGTVGYFAGDDGVIYKMKIKKIARNEECFVLEPLTEIYPNEKSKLKHVNVRIFGDTRSLPVHHLVAISWKGNYKYGMVVKFRDSDTNNTKPSNLIWKFERINLRKELERIEA